jgi:hypothetical protein
MIDAEAQTFLLCFRRCDSGGQNANIMPKMPRLFVDRFSEVFNLLEPYSTQSFYNFAESPDESGAVYVVGRQNLLDNMQRFRAMAESESYHMVFCNACEGSWTLESQILQLKIDQLVAERKILLIGAAEIAPQYPCLTLDHFLIRIMDFPENHTAQQHTQRIFDQSHKPYTFLFLNGRARPHRKYLYERMRRRKLLDHSLYTMLDARPTIVRHFTFEENNINVMATSSELRRLPDHYEVARYRDPVFGPITDRSNLKQELFRQEWGEIYIEPRAYIDTYFSIVTETVCAESDRSFRTEKIAKPLAMGHPFIVASTPGFYRDLRSLGFRTFGHVIDESFDLIANAQDRMDRVIDTVADLCDQDLDSFLTACEDVCKYNQQRLDEFTTQTRRDFPERFFQFLEHNG